MTFIIWCLASSCVNLLDNNQDIKVSDVLTCPSRRDTGVTNNINADPAPLSIDSATPEFNAVVNGFSWQGSSRRLEASVD